MSSFGALALTTTSSTTSDGSGSGAIVGLVVLTLVYLAVVAVSIWAHVRIVSKAGYPGVYVLLGLIPLVNIVFLLMFAFKEWPVERELAALRAQLRQQSYSPALPTAGPGHYGSLPPA